MAFCHPFDDPAVVAGQGTLGLELRRRPRRPGVASSCRSAAAGWRQRRGHRREVAAARTCGSIGVQAAVCAPYAGGASPTGPVLTLADGIAVKRPGDVTGPLVERVGRRGRRRRRGRHRRRDGDADGPGQALRRGRRRGRRRRAAVRRRRGRRRAGRRASCCRAATSTSAWCPALIRRHETEAGRRLVLFARIDDRPGQPGAVPRRVRRRRRQPGRGRAPARGRRPARPPDRRPRHVRGPQPRARPGRDRRRPRRRLRGPRVETAH